MRARARERARERKTARTWEGGSNGKERRHSRAIEEDGARETCGGAEDPFPALARERAGSTRRTLADRAHARDRARSREKRSVRSVLSQLSPDTLHDRVSHARHSLSPSTHPRECRLSSDCAVTWAIPPDAIPSDANKPLDCPAPISADLVGAVSDIQ